MRIILKMNLKKKTTRCTNWNQLIPDEVVNRCVAGGLARNTTVPGGTAQREKKWISVMERSDFLRSTNFQLLSHANENSINNCNFTKLCNFRYGQPR